MRCLVLSCDAVCVLLCVPGGPDELSTFYIAPNLMLSLRRAASTVRLFATIIFSPPHTPRFLQWSDSVRHGFIEAVGKSVNERAHKSTL